MQIKITPELLEDLKDKAKVIKQGVWMFQKDGSDYYPEHQFFTTPTVNPYATDGGDVIFNTADNDFFNVMDFIAAANPAVILALIAKIQDLQNKIHDLEAWTEYNQDMMDRDSAFKYELKVLLSLMKNSDPPVDDHKRMIEAVRELVANAKTNP